MHDSACPYMAGNITMTPLKTAIVAQRKARNQLWRDDQCLHPDPINARVALNGITSKA